MSEHIGQNVVTETGLADADRVLVYVDDNAGNAPESYLYATELRDSKYGNTPRIPADYRVRVISLED